MSEMMVNGRSAAARKWLGRLAHWVILGVTLAFVGWHIAGAAREAQQQPLRLDPLRLVVAGAVYLVGLTVLGVPWWLALRDTGERLGLATALRVYLVSHVGKYVPGKAMVIVIRCGLLVPRGVPAGRIAVTSFYETFATMASGSLVGLACATLLPVPAGFSATIGKEWWFLVGLAVLAAGFGASVLPSVFRIFSRMITLPFGAARVDGAHRFSGAACFGSLAAGLVAWSIMGASYRLTIDAVGDVRLGMEAIPMTIACVALSIVAGFVSMLPGQIGVRELILIEALVPVVGRPVAVAASLLFRLITVLAELGLGLILYLLGVRASARNP